MSLLMDALKRAEKARQAEAEKDRAQAGDDEPPMELSLDPLDDAAAEAAAGGDAGDAARTPEDSLEDSLDRVSPEMERELNALEDSAPVSATEREWAPSDDATAPHRAEPLSLDYAEMPLDDTGATLPSMRSAQRSVEDYFDGTSSVSLSMEEMQEAVGDEPFEVLDDGARPPEQQAQESTTKRTARAVLDSQYAPPARPLRTAVLILLPLLLLALLVGGAYRYKDDVLALLDNRPTVIATAPPPRSAPAAPPRAAPSPPVDAAAPAVPAPARPAVAGPPGVDVARPGEAAGPADAAGAERLAAAPSPPPAPAPESPPAAPGPASPPAATAAGRAAATTASPPSEPPPDVDLAQVLRGSGFASARAAAAVPGFKITRRRTANRTHRRLMAGYDALQRGEDGEAGRIYAQILARQPHNRDALLGLAAVNLRAGQQGRAAALYRQVLRRNPRDATAQAAMLALQDNLDPVAGESRLKILLQREPEQPQLHFDLGNLYARQARWPQAQQSYFDAYRRDDTNPDYAYNLAVSLDQLAQRRPALEYYRRALELSASRSAAFDPGAVRERVAALDTP